MIKAAILLFALVAFSWSVWAAPNETSGVVIQVVSGDTFLIEMVNIDPGARYIEQVRLADLDSPALDTQDGQAAKEFAKGMILGQTIWMDIDNKSQDGRDPLGRLLCVIYLEEDDGRINFTHPFNRILVDEGHAAVTDFDTNEFDPRDWWAHNKSEYILNYGDLVINEVELNPLGYDEDNEWVELYNRGYENADISGWSLVTAQDITLVLSPGTIIPAEGFYSISSEDYWLRNTDEVIVLFNWIGIEVDRTPHLSDAENDEYAWSRYPDGESSWDFVPSSRNSEVTFVDYEDDFDAYKKEDKIWLTCCNLGYSGLDVADSGLWNVSDFF